MSKSSFAPTVVHLGEYLEQLPNKTPQQRQQLHFIQKRTSTKEHLRSVLRAALMPNGGV